MNKPDSQTGALRLYAVTLLCFLTAACSGNTGSSSDHTGTGGSTARMTISGDYLYAIAGQDVQLFDISTASSPHPWLKIRMDWNIETLYPYGDYLLVGAADGMRIMDNTDPQSPTYINFPHAQAKDPVVAQDGYAYITLSGDDFDPAEVNQMLVVDINDINNPLLVDELPMQRPSGLSIDGNRLFVCDYIAGIKIFDTSDPRNLQSLDPIPDVICNDIIARNNILYVLTDNRLLQYDYSTSPPRPLSEIAPQP